MPNPVQNIKTYHSSHEYNNLSMHVCERPGVMFSLCHPQPHLELCPRLGQSLPFGDQQDIYGLGRRSR